MKTYILIIATILLAANADCSAQTANTSGLKSINGTKLFLIIKGKGTPLIVLHGGPGLNHSYFTPYLDDLEKDMRVVYYDQRSCGQSSIPSVDSISMKFLVEDIEAIRKELRVEKINILGHSWGAVLAVHYAERYKNHINKLILSNPTMLNRDFDQEAAALMQQKTTKQDSTERATILASGDLDVSKYDKLLRISFKASSYNPANVDKINLNLPPNFIAANQALFTALMKDPAFNTDMYTSLKSFDFPVLIVHGNSDLIPRASIDRLKKELPRAQLEVFEQSGHFPFVEENDRYKKTVLKFLK